ncbi:hypothetical protein D3C85_1588510 [compost metagenome]
MSSGSTVDVVMGKRTVSALRGMNHHKTSQLNVPRPASSMNSSRQDSHCSSIPPANGPKRGERRARLPNNAMTFTAADSQKTS